MDASLRKQDSDDAVHIALWICETTKHSSSLDFPVARTARVLFFDARALIDLLELLDLPGLLHPLDFGAFVDAFNLLSAFRTLRPHCPLGFLFLPFPSPCPSTDRIPALYPHVEQVKLTLSAYTNWHGTSARNSGAEHRSVKTRYEFRQADRAPRRQSTALKSKGISACDFCAWLLPARSQSSCQSDAGHAETTVRMKQRWDKRRQLLIRLQRHQRHSHQVPNSVQHRRAY